MSKPTMTEEAPEVASTPLPPEEENLAEHLRKVRGRRAYELLMSLKGKIHIDIDIDELRGRNRR